MSKKKIYPLPARLAMVLGDACDMCESVKVHGGPGHFNQTERCQYRPWVRHHCTCDACF